MSLLNTFSMPLATVAESGGSDSLWFWFETISMTAMLLILVADLLLILKRPHVPSMKEAVLWVVFYISLALIFAFVIWQMFSGDRAMEFVAGWLTEYSLSIDNLFVFVIIMGRFAVPKKYQQEVLMAGIIIALVLRGIFILLGAQALEHWSWIFYIFGVFLLWTAFKQVNEVEEAEGEADEENFLIRFMRKRFNFTKDYDGAKLRTILHGRKVFTPMLLVFISIGVTDLMFAIDSIPAIFGITQDPFIVFSANVFALMGLRQLYFLLGGLLDRLVYLHYGIAAILAFIGIKLIFHAMRHNELPFVHGGNSIEWVPEITTQISLYVIVGCLAVATIASLIKMRIDNKKAASTVEDDTAEDTSEPKA